MLSSPDDITRGFAPQQPAGATGPGEFSRLMLTSGDGRSVPLAIVGSPASQILLQLFALVNRSGADSDRTAADLRNSPDRTLAFPRAQQPANGIPKILVAKRRVFESADSAH